MKVTLLLVLLSLTYDKHAYVSLLVAFQLWISFQKHCWLVPDFKR